MSKFAHNPSYPDKVWFVSLELGRGHGATLAEALTMAQAEQTKRKAEIAQNFVPNAAYPYHHPKPKAKPTTPTIDLDFSDLFS